MTKRKKRTTLDMNRDNFNDQAIKGYYDTQYSTAWKAATIELSTNISKGNQGKHGFGANAVAKKYNENLLRYPNDKKINKTTLTRSFHSGEVGVSPKKQGRPNNPPPGLSKHCATHATMMQLSGEAEASGAHMSTTIKAISHNYASEGVHIILSLPNGTDTNTGNLKLGKEASVDIVKVLLPGIDPGSKVKDYETMVSYENWIGDLADVTTWVDEMKIYEANMQDNTPVPTFLFWFSIYKDEYDSLIYIY